MDEKYLEEKVPELIEASGKGITETVEELLEKGVDINGQNEYGNTALHATAFSGQADMAKLLCKYGADVNIKNKYGWTSLHLASRYGFKDVVEILLENKADPDATDNSGIHTNGAHKLWHIAIFTTGRNTVDVYL